MGTVESKSTNPFYAFRNSAGFSLGTVGISHQQTLPDIDERSVRYSEIRTAGSNAELFQVGIHKGGFRDVGNARRNRYASQPVAVAERFRSDGQQTFIEAAVSKKDTLVEAFPSDLFNASGETDGNQPGTIEGPVRDPADPVRDIKPLRRVALQVKNQALLLFVIEYTVFKRQHRVISRDAEFCQVSGELQGTGFNCGHCIRNRQAFQVFDRCSIGAEVSAQDAYRVTFYGFRKNQVRFRSFVSGDYGASVLQNTKGEKSVCGICGGAAQDQQHSKKKGYYPYRSGLHIFILPHII